jgi:hypothetical protein
MEEGNKKSGCNPLAERFSNLGRRSALLVRLD